MSKKSAGILAWKMDDGVQKVLLVHPGGPFYFRKDAGAWSIPKGELADGEDALTAAKREFEEEIGVAISGVFHPLHPIRQKSGKIVEAWSVETSVDISHFRSNTFTIEWPPKSGKIQEYPEVDRAEWFGYAEAGEKIIPSQKAFIDELDKQALK